VSDEGTAVATRLIVNLVSADHTQESMTRVWPNIHVSCVTPIERLILADPAYVDPAPSLRRLQRIQTQREFHDDRFIRRFVRTAAETRSIEQKEHWQMLPDFVRYTPEMETLDPDLDRLLERIVDYWEKTVRESPAVEGSGRAVRGAHAKTYG